MRPVAAALIFLFPLLAGKTPSGAVAAADYRQAVPCYHFQFPRDHFNHPDFQTEWWYYTGNLRTRDHHRYGFELVFFRQGAGERDRRNASRNPSAWRVPDIYMAHLALTDIDGRRFRYEQRVNRPSPGIAGVSFDQGRIWNGNWQAQWNLATGAQELSAVAEGIRFNLRLTPGKPPVIHGQDGVSQKAASAGHASYYVSFTRLEVSGALNGSPVSGTAWMDHEWFTNLLSPDQRGWDWFSVQRDDGAELMLFQVRRNDGEAPFAAGTYVDRSGRSTYLRPGDFSLQPLTFWTSPKTHARYPIRWRIAIPRLKLEFECAAALPDQELADAARGNSYWEGAVTYNGAVRGVGYLEMTGYAGPVKM